MRFNKKAALELSITAIVVLIIAITVLGLGIGFIKKQFGAGAELVSRELTGIKEQLKDQVRTGGELLVFSAPESVNIGKPQATFVGVRNTAANPDTGKVCFRVEVKCIQPFTYGQTCDPRNDANNVAVGGYDTQDYGFVQEIAPNRNWFKSLLSQFELRNYEGDVFDAVMLVRGIPPDQYQMEINVFKDPEDRACDNADFSDATASLYASKTFTLTVV